MASEVRPQWLSRILVAKIPIKLIDIGPAASSPVIIEITFKLIIINTMKKM